MPDWFWAGERGSKDKGDVLTGMVGSKLGAYMLVREVLSDFPGRESQIYDGGAVI